jgi:predicted ATPase/DNA-binding SARP family transcriptional activator
MQFGVLGPLEVRHDGVRLHLGGVRRRAVLARLVLDFGHVVTAERLIDDVWGDDPPATARKTLQKYVSELRQVLPEPVLRTATAGYLLDAPPDDCDVVRFERLVVSGDYAAALAVWRGDVLADLPDLGFVLAERARLDELRLSALHGRLQADLAGDRHEAVLAELVDILAAHPLDERFVELQMLALYRSGRQSEALAVFSQLRRRMTEELGVEPGADLRQLQVLILRQDPALELAASPAAIAEDGRAGGLPYLLTSFIGRDKELHTIEAAVDSNRLVTLTGPGGVGKTRLAVEVARRIEPRFEAGAWMVDLAELTTADQVPPAVALALHVDVRHATDHVVTIESQLARRGRCLIVLDNCEHLVAACAILVRRLMAGCPEVTVLATSRRPLGVDGEYVLPIRSLADEDAVQLFVARGRLAEQSSYDVRRTSEVAELCQRLDGLPLAIELAASQLRVLSLDELAARMSDHLTFRATRTSPTARQETLRDMVSWSYDLLPTASKPVFARLGVFMGSLTLAGAEAVCADLAMSSAEVLGHVTTLVDHSMLLRASPGAAESRFRLLESLRLFALQQLADSSALESAGHAHASYMWRLAAEAARHIYGPHEVTWQRRLKTESANLEAALTWASEHDWSLAVDLSVALWPSWDAGWGERKAVAYLARLLSVDDQAAEPDKRAWALTVAGDMAANQGDARRAVPWAREAVRVFGPTGDVRGRVCALTALGSALGGQGALHEAAEVIGQAVIAAERLGDDVLVARALNRQHFVAARHGDQVLAEELGRLELNRWRKVGSARGEATALRHLAVSAYRFGDLDAAATLCRQALTIWRELDDPAAVAHVQTTLADVARQRGDAAGATALYRAALVELQAICDRRCEASTCKNMAMIRVEEQSYAEGARLFREAILLRQELDDQAGLAECLEGLAVSLHGQSRHEDAAALLGAAAALRSSTESLPSAAEADALARIDLQVKAALEPERFTTNWQRGHRMSLGQTIDLALDRPTQSAG